MTSNPQVDNASSSTNTDQAFETQWGKTWFPIAKLFAPTNKTPLSFKGELGLFNLIILLDSYMEGKIPGSSAQEQCKELFIGMDSELRNRIDSVMPLPSYSLSYYYESLEQVAMGLRALCVKQEGWEACTLSLDRIRAMLRQDPPGAQESD